MNLRVCATDRWIADRLLNLPDAQPLQPNGAKDSRRRLISWRFLIAALTLPAFLGGSVLLVYLLRQVTDKIDALIIPAVVVVLIGVITAAVVSWRIGPRRNWNTPMKLRLGWGILVMAVLWAILQTVPALSY